MEEITLWAKGLADVARVRIVAALQNGELCVCELVDALEMSQSNLSSHLQILRQVGMVTVRKDGKWSYYTLVPAHRPLIETLFQYYARLLDSDPRRRRDAARLHQRLALRDDGRCVLSFVQLDSAEKGGVSV